MLMGLDLLDEAPHCDVAGEAIARICDYSLKVNKFRLKPKYKLLRVMGQSV